MCTRSRKAITFYDIGKDPKIDEGHSGIVTEVKALPSSSASPCLLPKDTFNTILKDGPIKTRARDTQAFSH